MTSTCLEAARAEWLPQLREAIAAVLAIDPDYPQTDAEVAFRYRPIEAAFYGIDIMAARISDDPAVRIRAERIAEAVNALYRVQVPAMKAYWQANRQDVAAVITTRIAAKG